jgi:L-amino acid N-acyltransferase YncA
MELRQTLVTGLVQALEVRKIRNECRKFMTRFQGEIGVFQQIRWYFSWYRQQLRQSSYRLYLFRNAAGEAIAYGALQQRKGAEGRPELWVTEGVKTAWRGRGVGASLLESLCVIAGQEGQDLVAEIWATNLASLRLHEKAGFVFESATTHEGQALKVLRRSRPLPVLKA